MNRIISSFLLLALVALPGLVAAEVEISSQALIEVEVVNEKGEKEIQQIQATKVLPGTELLFVNSCLNSGEKAADDVAIHNPVPEHMTYVGGSAYGKGTIITFSVDGGQNFASPEKLTVKDAEGKESPAEAKDYTHIRWLLKKLAPGEQGEVGFRARLN
ncbi:MAG: hypothetical protein IH614_20610 [Desulfuromonadales bacterium]|nr:hypothetical protein [Desulfuromonadales bacterium]